MAGFDTRAPIFAAAILAFVNFAFGYFAFRETLAHDKRRPFSWLRANPLGALWVIGRVPGAHRWLAAAFLFSIAFTIYPILWSYYGRIVAGWDAQGVGLSLAVVGASFALVQLFLLGPMVARLGALRVLRIGIAASFLSFLGLAFAPNALVIYLLFPLNALAIVVNPMVQSILSNSVDETQQGELQGLSTALSSIAAFLAPFIFLNAFIWAVPSDPEATIFPGFPFLIASALMIVLMALTWRAKAS